MQSLYWKRAEVDSSTDGPHTNMSQYRMLQLSICTFHLQGGVKSSPPSAAYMRQWIGSALIEIMACRLFGTKPLT